MNCKGQFLIPQFCGGIIALFVLIAILLFVSWVGGLLPGSDFEIGADNFCQAWATENNKIYIDGDFYYDDFLFLPISNPTIQCIYGESLEVFDGGTSFGKHQYIDFSISKEEILRKWH